jgi:hypothetical protein
MPHELNLLKGSGNGNRLRVKIDRKFAHGLASAGYTRTRLRYR